jgi:hypothetical protein
METKTHIRLLWIFLAMFLFRVCAQLLQAFFNFNFLPEFEKWQSGTLPYSVLLTFQLIILLVFARNCVRAETNALKSNKKTGKFLKIFGSVYFIAMLIRYAVSMAFYPEMRWTGHILPIFFHLVLASYLITLGRLHGILQTKTYEKA